MLDVSAQPRHAERTGRAASVSTSRLRLVRRRRRPNALLALPVDIAVATVIAASFWGLVRVTSPSIVELLIVVVGWPLALGAAGAYGPRASCYRSDEVRCVLRAAAGLLAVAATSSYLLGAPIGRDLLLGVSPLLPLASLAVRAAIRRASGRALGGCASAPRLLLVGADVQVRELATRFRSAPAGDGRVVGAVLDKDSKDLGLGQDTVLLSGFHRIPQAVDRVAADTVVIAAGQLSPEALRGLAWSLEECGVDLVVAPGLVDVDRHRLSVRVAAGVPLINVTEGRLHGARPWGKELLDRTVAGAMLLVLGPLLLAPIALALKLVDPGPVLFRQQRLGRNGKLFSLYKFRTMRTAYSGRPPLEVFKEMGRPDLVQEWLENQKLRQDPRVSAMGDFLRRSSLDELPQLLNVLRGELSLVGPRPIVQEELARFGSNSSRILACKPGITGMWQVAGRNDLSYDERVRLNVYYVDNWRLFLDFKLLLKTVKILFTRKGAF